MTALERLIESAWGSPDLTDEGIAAARQEQAELVSALRSLVTIHDRWRNETDRTKATTNAVEQTMALSDISRQILFRRFPAPDEVLITLPPAPPLAFLPAR